MTGLDPLHALAASRVPASNTGLRVPQIMLATLLASAGFNMLLGLQQQAAEHLIRSAVGEWVRYVVAVTGPAFPT